MGMQLLSTAFTHQGDIPDLYSCRGKNISPPLSWKNPPKETACYALIAEDPDAPIGTVTHWVIYNIPPEKHELPEGVPERESFSDGTVQGKNMRRRNGYMGPCPPWGRHRYYFRIYALDATITPDSKMSRKRLMAVIEPHVLDQAQLMGYYSKK
jgi:Raf kinase inhibitor-like YbhB/YbcL family protein